MIKLTAFRSLPPFRTGPGQGLFRVRWGTRGGAYPVRGAADSDPRTRRAPPIALCNRLARSLRSRRTGSRCSNRAPLCSTSLKGQKRWRRRTPMDWRGRTRGYLPP